tara:strand:+ start:1286 stop:1837 length:552 start_codon:yes stop_codon:yes gene_type:complete
MNVFYQFFLNYYCTLNFVKLMKIYFILFMYFFTLPLYSQSYLELKKLGKKRKIEFFSGEEIRFKIKNDENFSMARITGIYDNYINFNNIRVNIDDIELIDIRHKSSNTFKGIGYIISGTSLGFFAIDIINLSVVQKNTLKRSFNEKIGITSLTGIFLGISITFIKKKYFKNKGLNRIRSKTIF